jgi:hypothetical protein
VVDGEIKHTRLPYACPMDETYTAFEDDESEGRIRGRDANP